MINFGERGKISLSVIKRYYKAIKFYNTVVLQHEKTDDFWEKKNTLKTKRYRDIPIHSGVYYFTKGALKIEKDIIMDCGLTFHIRADEQPC